VPGQYRVQSGEIGRRIKELRREQGVSQVELGRRLSVSHVQVSYLETGKRRFTVPLIERIADALGTSTEAILLRTRTTRESLQRPCEVCGGTGRRDVPV
jgi:transcriptional regulator with XRE-family HTH domain